MTSESEVRSGVSYRSVLAGAGRVQYQTLVQIYGRASTVRDAGVWIDEGAT